MKAESGDRKPEREKSQHGDFRARTFQFGIRCVRLVESLPKAMPAQTIVEEECDEALYWIDVLVELGLTTTKRVEQLKAEANQIISITVASIKTARKGARK